MSKQSPSAPTASAVGPCPTIIQISRKPRHWRFTQHHCTTRPPLDNFGNDLISTKVSYEPVGGDVIAVDTANFEKKIDRRCDKYLWVNDGIKKYPNLVQSYQTLH